MNLPLEMYLTDVPDDKVFILCNMRSAFTNTFLVRNNDIGRELMRDWLGIIESGFVQCHGWDQVSSETPPRACCYPLLCWHFKELFSM